MTSEALVHIDLGSYRLEDQVGYLLRLATQRHTAIFQAAISEDLTPTQFSALVRVAEQGTVSQNQLGRLAAMDVATVKGVVDRLKAKGLILSRPDARDKRRATISLTDAGAALMDRLVADGHAITEQTLAPLTGAEQEMLRHLLTKLA